ncbi:hypothetical protein ACLE20_00480 [Rhizobium sp. YIM 134829]|uniref:hypothetical protein n=1 Tax=Rhizobium sp. YIM 134829 TaxID=3390453 RepID=UPI00397CA71A
MHVTATGWPRSPFDKRNGSANGGGDDRFSVLAEAGLSQSATQQGGAAPGSWTPAPAQSPSIKLSSVLAGSTFGTSSASASKAESPADEFLTWSRMTPAERIRAQYLKDHNLTEESLKAAKPEEREAIEKEIAERIKRELGGKEAEDKHESELAKRA